MELRQLQYFLAVAEELNFGRAAERLQIAQPPLSRQIRQFEKELDVELFYRTKRSVELTEAGQAFLEEARQILVKVEQSVRVAQRAIASECFIMFQRNRGCGLYDQAIAICQRAGFSPRVIQEADEMQVMLGFVAAELGIALLSASVQHFQRPGVVYRPLQPSTPKVALAVAWWRDAPSAVLQAFIEVVRECARGC